MSTTATALALVGLLAWAQAPTTPTAGSAPPSSAPPEASAPAPDSPEGRAQAHYKKSKQLFAERQYQPAIAELEAAHALVPSPALLYNIARCHERLGDLGSAIGFYQKYLDSAVGAADAEVVQGLIKHYREQLAKNAEPRTPEQRAAVLARKGRDYYRAGRYADAVAQLEQAQGIVAKSAFIYNIAKCYEKMGDYDNALVHYERYLGMEPEASDRQDVLALIVALKARMRQTLSELTVRTVPVGADVYIDEMGKLLGQTPLEVRLKPGSHKLVLVKNGYESVEREFEMPDDRPRDLAYALVKVKNYGGIAVDSEVNGAQIFLDGKILALTPYSAIKLVEQGSHQVTVQREGFYLYQAETEVARGKLSRVHAQLPERGELTGWMTTFGSWVAGASLLVGGLTAGISYGLGGFTVQGTPISENFWTAQQVGMYGGLGGIALGLGLIGLDLIIQPSDRYEKVGPGADLPGGILDEDEEELGTAAGGAA